MTVPVQIPISKSTANGVTTVFPYGFKISKAEDLVVTVNGLVRTLNVHYTLDGIGNDTGGNVTFLAAPADGSAVVRRRVMAFKRTTDYQNLGDLLASTLNGDQDDPIMMIQQLAANSLQMVEQSDGEFVWDANGLRIINVGDGIELTDAINMGQAFEIVEQTLTGAGSSGGGLSATPKFLEITGDGESTDFAFADADIDNPLFYDVVLNGEMQEPYTDYTIVGTPGDYSIRFTVAPAADGTGQGFAVLRGYARPYTGTQPILTVAPTLVTVTADATIDGTYQNKLILVTANADITLTIRANTGAANDWADGEFFSVVQLGTGAVTIAVEAGGTVNPLAGFLAKTRDQNSVISATCIYADSDQWAVTGDLLRASNPVEKQAFILPCSDEASTDISVASDVYRFRMPYGFKLTDVRGSLNVAQPSGTLLTVDVKKGGVSIFSTTLTFDNAELTTTTAATPAVISDAVLADDDAISVDVTQVGTAGARGLKIMLIGERA